MNKKLVGILGGAALSLSLFAASNLKAGSLRTGYVAHLEKKYVKRMCKDNKELKAKYRNNLEQCVQDVNESFNQKIQVVKRLMDFNLAEGYFGDSLPRPSNYSMVSASEEDKLRIAAEAARDITPKTLSYFNSTMREVIGHNKIKRDLYKAIRNDIIAAGVLTAVGSYYLGDGVEKLVNKVSHKSPKIMIRAPGVN